MHVAAAGLRPGDGSAPDARAAAAWARGAEFAGLRLDASALRARELDRSARRDVAAMLQREGLATCGMDLWIPAEHFADAARLDRALAAAVGALELIADFARLLGASARAMTLGLTLPEALSADVLAALEARADATGVAIADHRAGAWGAVGGSGPIGVGLDPASVLAAGERPETVAARLGERLAAARLTDLDAAGVRVVPGAGRLDVEAYAATLGVVGYDRAVVLDLRGLPDHERAAREAIEAWRDALPDIGVR